MKTIMGLMAAFAIATLAAAVGFSDSANTARAAPPPPVSERRKEGSRRGIQNP